MRFGWMAAVSAVLVVLAAAEGWPVEAAVRDPSSDRLDQAADALTARARSILDDNLVDYSSARLRRFRAVRAPRIYYSDGGNPRVVPFVHRGEPRIVFCGEVNSRNRMGGFTGWRPVAIQPEEENWNALVVGGERTADEQLTLLCDPAASDAEQGSRDYSDLLASDPVQ